MTSVASGPTEAQCAALATARPSPALQPREVIETTMCALHQKNLESPYARFGSEVAMRFLSPTSPAARSSLSRFADYLSQEWYRPLVEWSDMRWDGDLVFLSNGNECYQQVGIRCGPRQPWKSVRWILSLVPADAGPEWRISSVFVQEPDAVQVPSGDEPSKAEREYQREHLARAEPETPPQVVDKVMRALRRPNEPYPLHGCEVAIRYCSPSNAASRLSPQGFASYLREPWYRIMTEWNEIQVEEEIEPVSGDGSVVMQNVLVRRSEDESWTVVNWQLSLHSGCWLTDSLTITE